MKFLATSALLLVLTAAPAQASEVFGVAEVKDPHSKLYKAVAKERLKNWRKITKKYLHDVARGGKDSNEFRGQILKLRGKTKLETMFNVNKYVNDKITYRTDNETWENNEYWANPIETVGKGSYGDCDDYALAKYFALQQLGFQEKHLNFIALMSEGGGHAVLAVKEKGKTYILDNNLQVPVADERIDFYDPIYAVNNKSFKLYKPLPDSKAKNSKTSSGK